jgi:hypothetical protein
MDNYGVNALVFFPLIFLALKPELEVVGTSDSFWTHVSSCSSFQVSSRTVGWLAGSLLRW